MDDDASGLISFTEFTGMVREELLLGPEELPEKVLKAVWLAIDSDGSGQLKVGEFGAFMNLGLREKSNEEKAALRREHLILANQRASQEVKAKRDKLLDRDMASSMRGEPPATDEEVCLAHASTRSSSALLLALHSYSFNLGHQLRSRPSVAGA